MPTQKVMFYTKDNKIIVADVDFTGYDDTRKRLELQRIQHYFGRFEYSSLLLSQYPNRASLPDAEKSIISLMDEENTAFVNIYCNGFDYMKNRSAYQNNVGANNFPPHAKKPNTLHFDYSVSDSVVPEFVKNLGFHIEPEEVVTNVNIDDPDFENNFYKQTARMEVSSSSKIIKIYRNHFVFPPADYVRLRSLITAYNSLSPKPDINQYCQNLSSYRDRQLFNIYSQEVDYLQRKETLIHHEFHHIKNRMVFNGIMHKPDVKRLTPENTYRLEVENERSAYLSETIECINRYLKGRNFSDYSMFDNFCEDLPKKLQGMTDSQKVAYLTNMENIVNYALKRFKDKKRDWYDRNQFKNSTETSLLAQPLDVPEDLNGEQYRLMRSAFYSISVYNPLTGKNETRNLSKYIRPEDEVQINTQQMQTIVNPAKAALQRKLNEFNTDSHKPNVNPDLLDEARAFYRHQMRSPRIISEAQTINVADLLDGRPQPDEHNPTPVPPTPVPDDKADWSDELQKYWSQFEGYKEKAKNNLEYSFAIKNQDVSYTAPDKVHLSKTCQYEMYDRLVKEPSSAKKAIRFENTLSKEQALMLYVACINNGRKMRGAIPTDLSNIDTMISIPKSERDMFKTLTTSPAAAAHSAPVACTISPSRTITR